MSHIKSLINNVIMDRTDEAGFDLHRHIKNVMRNLTTNAVKEESNEFVPALLYWSKRDFLASEIAQYAIDKMRNSNHIAPRDPDLVMKALNPNDPTAARLVINGFYSDADAKEWLAGVIQRLADDDEDIDPEYSGVQITTDFDE